MLHVPSAGGNFGLITPSYGTDRPGSGIGTAVAEGIGSYGAWTQIGSALPADAYGIYICIHAIGASSASHQVVCDIGVDGAGGTAFVSKIPDLICGGAGNYSTPTGPQWHYFPIFIPSGATIGARFNSYLSIPGTPFVWWKALHYPSNPDSIRLGSFVEPIGVTGNNGVVVTPGDVSDGIWTTIGTTTKHCWHWQLAYQGNTGFVTWSGVALHFDLGFGPGPDIVMIDRYGAVNVQEFICGVDAGPTVFYDVPAGTDVKVRIQTSTTINLYQVAAYGVGG